MKTPKIPTTFKTCLISSLLAISLFGCSDDDDGEGYIKLYNASPDSPVIYMTVDEDLDEDSDDDDDHYESTYSGVSYGSAHSNITLDEDTYEYQLAWQDEDDTTDVDDLVVLHTSEIKIKDDYIHMVVLTGSILASEVTVYDIPEIDTDDDDNDDVDDDLFNMRILNLSSTMESLDFYFSEEDETFNEAEFLGSMAYQELSENEKHDQEDYIFYITLAGSDEVLFTSESIAFNYASQNIMIVRENQGSGSSPYVLDKMSDSSVIEYVDTNSEAQLSFYNTIIGNYETIIETDLPQETYEETVAVHLNGITDEPLLDSLAYGEMSESFVLDSGDYTLDITTLDNSEAYLSNHLIPLIENTNQTVFIYSEYEYVDNDNDGDYDETDGGSGGSNGIIDEIEIDLYTLIVENSTSTSIYSHEVEVVNFIQDDDFATVTVYFVKDDENIDDAENSATANYTATGSTTLLNNTYTVQVVAKVNTSEKILNTFELILDEESKDQYLILEATEDLVNHPTGYKAALVDQIITVEETE